jgi:hypothetical protein
MLLEQSNGAYVYLRPSCCSHQERCHATDVMLPVGNTSNT